VLKTRIWRQEASVECIPSHSSSTTWQIRLRKMAVIIGFLHPLDDRFASAFVPTVSCTIVPSADNLTLTVISKSTALQCAKAIQVLDLCACRTPGCHRPQRDIGSMRSTPFCISQNLPPGSEAA
jgi:hypothetical protein